MPLATISLPPSKPIASVYRPTGNTIAPVYKNANSLDPQSITNGVLISNTFNPTLVFSEGQTFTPASDPSNPQNGEFIVEGNNIILQGSMGKEGVVLPAPPQPQKIAIGSAPEWTDKFGISKLTFSETLEGVPTIDFEFVLNPVGDIVQEALDYFDANTEHEVLGIKYYCEEGVSPEVRIIKSSDPDRYYFKVKLTGNQQERATPRCHLKTQWDIPHDPAILRKKYGQKVPLRALGKYVGEDLYFYLPENDVEFLVWRSLHEDLAKGRGFWYWGNNIPELRKFSDRPQWFLAIDEVLEEGEEERIRWKDSPRKGGAKHRDTALAYEYAKTKLTLEKRNLDAEPASQKAILLSVTRENYSEPPDRYARSGSEAKRRFLSSNSVFHDAGGPTDTVTWTTVVDGTTVLIVQETWGFQYDKTQPVLRLFVSGGPSEFNYGIRYNNPSLNFLWKRVARKETVYKFDRDRYLVKEETTGWIERRWKAGGVKEIPDLQQELQELINENNGAFLNFDEASQLLREKTLLAHKISILSQPYRFEIAETVEYQLKDLDLIYPKDRVNPIPQGYKSPKYLKKKTRTSSSFYAIPDIFSSDFEDNYLEGIEPFLPSLTPSSEAVAREYPIISVGEDNYSVEGQRVIWELPDIFESFALQSNRDTNTNNARLEQGFQQQLGRISEATKRNEPQFPENPEATTGEQIYLHTLDSRCHGEDRPHNGEISFSGVGDRATALKLAQFQLTQGNLAALTRDLKYIPFIPMQVGDRARLDNRDWVVLSLSRTVVVEGNLLCYGNNDGSESYFQSIQLGSYLPDIPIDLEIV